MLRADTVEAGLASLPAECSADPQVAEVLNECPMDAIDDAGWPTVFTSVVNVVVEATTQVRNGGRVAVKCACV